MSTRMVLVRTRLNLQFIANTGYEDASSGIGVYFGLNSKHNYSRHLSGDSRPTSQRAGLHAAIAAIYRAKRVHRHTKNDLFGSYWKQPSKSREMVLLTDSAYVKGAFNTSIERWAQNGWTNAKGRDVANRDLFEKLAKLKEEMGDFLVVIHIPRRLNVGADALAKAAL